MPFMMSIYYSVLLAVYRRHFVGNICITAVIKEIKAVLQSLGVKYLMPIMR
jgi:hypothetical protein